uniref:Tick transposon n=1 Tax=Rhipicephalus appendiculatus TaxID=34631 RepID=A0A131YFQ1_RHIAP
MPQAFVMGWSIERPTRYAIAHTRFFLSVLLYMEKAYDTTWRFGILRDIPHFGVGGKVLTIIERYTRALEILFLKSRTRLLFSVSPAPNPDNSKYISLYIEVAASHKTWRSTRQIIPRTKNFLKVSNKVNLIGRLNVLTILIQTSERAKPGAPGHCTPAID